jgi:hypothetical protein
VSWADQSCLRVGASTGVMVYNSISTMKGKEGVHYNYQKSLPIEDTLVQTLPLYYVLNSLHLRFKAVITYKLPPYESVLAFWRDCWQHCSDRKFSLQLKFHFNRDKESHHRYCYPKGVRWRPLFNKSHKRREEGKH